MLKNTRIIHAGKNNLYNNRIETDIKILTIIYVQGQTFRGR